jgi:hypothetical protein
MGRSLFRDSGCWLRRETAATHRFTGSRRGRPRQNKAKNLLNALLGSAEQVLALLDDLRIPFTNHQAEWNLCLAKVQQKI